jgi:glutamate--cysteine ligase catalytic subunit
VEEGDDGYGVKYSSMFSGMSNGNASPSNVTESDGDLMDDDGVSLRRKQSPFAMGSDEENSYEYMTMSEIMTGRGNYFPGLIPLVYAYLDHIQCDEFTFSRVSQYLELIEKRAKGELLTPATWMRNFVRSHPAYKGDSVVSEEIAYDLMIACKEIGEGTRHEPSLLGDLRFAPISTAGAYDVKLDAKRVQNAILLEKLQRYTHRESFKEKGTGPSIAVCEGI